jgi:hypothetical protein
MPRTFWTLALAGVLCSVWVAGCSSKGSSGPDSGQPTDSGQSSDSGAPADAGQSKDAGVIPDAGPLSDAGYAAQQFLTAYLAASCQQAQSCSPQAAYLQGQCAKGGSALAAQMVADVNSGVVTFNSSAAQTCLGSIATLSCGSLSPPVGCTSVFSGTVANGKACSYDTECAQGTCVQNGTSSCAGKCTAYAGVNQDCTVATCDPGPPLSCWSQVLADSGVQSTCIPPVADGGSCASGQLCASGLSCVNGNCLPPTGGSGSSCNGGCSTGFYCGEVSGTCQTLVPDGGACNDQSACGTTMSCRGWGYNALGATNPGQCMPPVDVSGPCVSPPDGGLFYQYVTGCLAGLACVNGACEIPPSSGSCAADPYTSCDPLTSYCDPGTNTCQPLIANGTASNAQFGSPSCQSALTNPNGQCTPDCTGF